ncbi:MAG: hypothetical protein RL367_2382, partial [Pseudomonadota bacterium]
TAGLTFTGSNGFTITPQFRWFSASFGDNDHSLPIDAHGVADLSGHYPLTPGLTAFVQAQNLFNTRFVADNNGFEPRRLNRPLTVMAGLRFRLD